MPQVQLHSVLQNEVLRHIHHKEETYVPLPAVKLSSIAVTAMCMHTTQTQRNSTFAQILAALSTGLIANVQARLWVQSVMAQQEFWKLLAQMANLLSVARR